AFARYGSTATPKCPEKALPSDVETETSRKSANPLQFHETTGAREQEVSVVSALELRVPNRVARAQRDSIATENLELQVSFDDASRALHSGSAVMNDDGQTVRGVLARCPGDHAPRAFERSKRARGLGRGRRRSSR